MKKINPLLTIALLGGLLAGCKKDTIFTYNAPDDVYFNVSSQGQPVDTTDFTFAYAPVTVTDSVYKMALKITGPVSDHDRTFKVSVDTGTTAVSGKHFTLPETFTFHANMLLDTFPLKIMRTVDLQTQPVVLRIKLEPTTDFHVDLGSLVTNFGDTVSLVSFKMNLSDILGRGSYWDGIFATYFGTFSVKKVRLINQIAGMPLDYYTTGWLTDLNLSARASFYAITVAQYLNDQHAAGNTIYEDDGVTPMTMGAAYQ